LGTPVIAELERRDETVLTLYSRDLRSEIHPGFLRLFSRREPADRQHGDVVLLAEEASCFDDLFGRLPFVGQVLHPLKTI
jgi:hypothetical protein